MSDCVYCGNSPDAYRSTNALYGKEKQSTERNWWCFGSKKRTNSRECADDCIAVGKYEKRRSTVAYNHRISNFSGIKKKLQDSKTSLATSIKSNVKFLLVFDVVDLTCEAIRKAAEKLNFDVTHCSTKESAYDEFQSKHHDLVLIDTRSKNLEYDVLCRALRTSKGSLHAPIIAIVRKSFFEKDEEVINNLLEIGFQRCITESSSVTNYFNELMQVRRIDMKSMLQKSVSQTLYVALDQCKNLVFITNDNYKCQYSNVLIHKTLNIRQDEILGKNLVDEILCNQTQVNMISSHLLRNREWSGCITLKKRNSECIGLECKAIPISCFGRLTTHFVFIMDLSTINNDISPKEYHQMINYNEKRMSEVRKVSLNKLKALPLEAPITKIITLMDEVKQKLEKNPELIDLLDKAEDILRNSELYTTQLNKNYRLKHDEPVVSELITALLSDQPSSMMKTNMVTSRRSSNDSAVFKVSKVVKVNDLLDEILENALKWNFEIFQLEEMTKNRPLQALGMHFCQVFDIANSLLCDEKTLKNWFIIIESHYHVDNFYHNSTHAADVMQATAGFLQTNRIKSIMEPLDAAICLLAAAAHDVDHPGKSSAFLSNSNDKLAVLYNDITILENHHAACMFKLTLGDERVNIFKNLDRDMYKVIRHNMIDMILATEMTKHFEHLTKFVNVFCTTDEEENTNDIITLSLPENIGLIKRMLIKCADVSNPSRPFRIYVEWARRIAEEYFQQTDEEKIRGLPVVMPMFDRDTCSVPKSQIGFVDYIVNDMFEAWNAFIDMPELINYLRQNYIKWKEFDASGHKTLADIKLLQSSALLAPVLQSKSKLSN